MFSLGCLYYYILTDGVHPFGDVIRRETNILDNNCCIKPGEIQHTRVENVWFIPAMLSNVPSARPTASAIIKLPMFWEKQKTLRFLDSVGEFLRKKSQIVRSYENKLEAYATYFTTSCRQTSGMNWKRFLCRDVQKYLQGLSYKETFRGMFIFICDLNNNYDTLPLDVKRAVGELPGPFLDYWVKRFPFLVATSWAIFQELRHLPQFNAYYDSSFIFPMAQVQQGLKLLQSSIEERAEQHNRLAPHKRAIYQHINQQEKFPKFLKKSRSSHICHSDKKLL